MTGYVCNVCDREFKRTSHLNRHLKLHAVNKKPKSPPSLETIIISSDEEVTVKDIQRELEELMTFNMILPTEELYPNFEGCSSSNPDNKIIENNNALDGSFEQDIIDGIKDLIDDIYKEDEEMKKKEEEEMRKKEEEEMKKKEEEEEMKKKKDEEEKRRKSEDEEKKKKEEEETNRIKEITDKKREKAAMILMINKLKKLKRGTEASICGVDHCCTVDMMRQISSVSRRELLTNHTRRMAEFGDWLQQRADKFDDVFREMLNSSKQGFHAMFMKTYGVIYEQHSYVFTDLFKQLEKYYTKGNVDLTDTLDDFFNTLYQKMFTVLNSGYRFNDKYLECINERMKELKPFGDVPGKLTTLLRRSFYATRTFSQGLHVAAEVIRNMQNVTLSESCHASVAKMLHCSVCSGYGELLPCLDYCTNVTNQCYAYHTQLDYNWKVFINATDKVIERLLGPFNIEMVIIPIDIKISEAIMIFQENAQEVSQRVFAGCGKPELGRNKRANGEIEFETLDFSNRGMGGMENGRGGKGDEQGKLERVIRDTRLVLRNEKDFWRKLPSHMCEKSLKADTCWDGKTKVKSPAPTRPTRIVDPQLEPKSLVNEQIFALKYLSVKLNHAYNGVDEDWIDSEDMDSGSGSGSGSGIDLSESGSGDSPTEVPESSAYPFPTRGEEEQGVGGGGGGGSGSDNKEPNEIAPIPDLSRPSMGNNTRSRTATASASRLTFNFIVPIIMVSFGSTIIDWIL